MNAEHATEEAIDILQQLGLKEYEARCFVGLSRLSTGTAKDLSEVTEVPRTRVYDAIRVLEARGLVEIQHTSPQQYRTVSIEEAIETLRERYDTRCERLADALEEAGSVSKTGGVENAHEVWTLSDGTAISTRTQRIVEEAAEEVVLVLGEGSALSDSLELALADLDGSVGLYVGAVDENLRRSVGEEVPNAATFDPDIDWLRSEGDGVAITRVLLVDRATILVSTRDRRAGTEFAVFGRGFTNGLVVLARRLLTRGLPTPNVPNPTE